MPALAVALISAAIVITTTATNTLVKPNRLFRLNIIFPEIYYCSFVQYYNQKLIFSKKNLAPAYIKADAR